MASAFEHEDACVEAQRRIGKRRCDYIISMKAGCPLCEESPVVRRVLDRHAVYLKV
jgi:hypothetical protein